MGNYASSPKNLRTLNKLGESGYKTNKSDQKNPLYCSTRKSITV